MQMAAANGRQLFCQLSLGCAAVTNEVQHVSNHNATGAIKTIPHASSKDSLFKHHSHLFCCWLCMQGQDCMLAGHLRGGAVVGVGVTAP